MDKDISNLKNLDDWLIENEGKDIKELNNLIRNKKLYYNDASYDEEFTAIEFMEDDWFIYGINEHGVKDGYPPESCFFV